MSEKAFNGSNDCHNVGILATSRPWSERYFVRGRSLEGGIVRNGRAVCIRALRERIRTTPDLSHAQLR